MDFEAIVGKEVYDGYWIELDRVITELEHSQEMADGLRRTIAEASHLWQARPIT